MKWVRRVAILLLVLLVPAPVLVLLLFRFVPVPVTPQMLLSALFGAGGHHQWVGEEISPQLFRAVIAGEDDRFCSHHGFDWSSVDKAVQAHEQGKRLRGASTISQQTARSVFLLPVRSWLRKGAEAWLTVLMEALWPKERIITVYLNVVDWGHGNFGAEAAARAYFGKSAAALSGSQAAKLAAVLPDPDQWNAARPGPYVAAHAAVLRRRMAEVQRDGLDSCLGH
ncbi:MAG TPA: monofunctional biosynthetic peptidoglycan transglycosylase [Rhizomicrobium sp.]|jgi:monofunctional biosynthetic peptidoglycan transglycosylase